MVSASLFAGLVTHALSEGGGEGGVSGLRFLYLLKMESLLENAMEDLSNFSPNDKQEVDLLSK